MDPLCFAHKSIPYEGSKRISLSTINKMIKIFFHSRFGFVSFENQDGVNAVLSQGSIFFLGKKINVGPAVKKKVRSFPLIFYNIWAVHIVCLVDFLV